MATFCVTQEGPVNALALNRDNTQVAIGGRNVFKVYLIEDDKFKEVCNLRPSKNSNLGFSCNDVSWSSTDDHYLATAATNGHVCVWNLTKMGKAMQEQDYQEHKRTVNKVNFHASEPNKLISGSQDGTMRYFDIRMKNAAAIFYSNTESVRDVQFSPHMPHNFAAVSENGSVQLWDVRRTDKCQMQFTAHSGPVFACDWHPENTWLATASRDKTIKVWDLQSKPTLEYTIHTIASIGHVKWRPQRKFHIASCALVVDCSINIWDIRRPYIPFAAFNEHKDIASGVAWKGDPHVFLSTGRDAYLYQHSFRDASRPASKANPQGMSLNNKGEVLYASRVTASTNSLPKTAAGIMRKSSTSSSTDQFHQATSVIYQFCKINLMQSEEISSFCALATNYVLSGYSLSEICERNAVIARKYGKFHVSIIWKIIKTMYGEEYVQNSVSSITTNNREDTLQHTLPSGIGMEHNVDLDQRSKGGDTPAAHCSGGDDETETEDQMDHLGIYNFPSYQNMRNDLPKGDFSFGENELDMDFDDIRTDFRNGYRASSHTTPLPPTQDWTLPTEAFAIRHEILDRSPPPDRFPDRNSPDINDDGVALPVEEKEKTNQGLLTVAFEARPAPWDAGGIVADALRHHATTGDVQTSACALVVLGEHRRLLGGLDEATQEHWLLGYIELLNRYKLWNVATQIIKLSWIPSINQLNQQSTRINTNCSKCSKPLQRTGWLCDRCHSSEYALCSVCHQVVKGLYVWCQGCSHGGHLAHMQQWLRTNRFCPTGCGHACEYR